MILLWQSNVFQFCINFWFDVLVIFMEANDFSNFHICVLCTRVYIANEKYSWYEFELAPNVFVIGRNTKKPRLWSEVRDERRKERCNQMFKFTLELFYFVFVAHFFFYIRSLFAFSKFVCCEWIYTTRYYFCFVVS